MSVSISIANEQILRTLNLESKIAKKKTQPNKKTTKKTSLDLTRNAKTSVNINEFLLKFSECLNLSTGCRCIVLEKIENRLLFKIANQHLQNMHYFAIFLNFAPI